MNRDVAIISLHGVTTFNSDVDIFLKSGHHEHIMDCYAVCFKTHLSLEQTTYGFRKELIYDYDDVERISVESGCQGTVVHVGFEDRDKELNKYGKLK